MSSVDDAQVLYGDEADTVAARPDGVTAVDVLTRMADEAATGDTDDAVRAVLVRKNSVSDTSYTRRFPIPGP